MKNSFAAAALCAALSMTPALLPGQERPSQATPAAPQPRRSAVHDMNDEPPLMALMTPIALSATAKNGYTLNGQMVLGYDKKETEKIDDDKWAGIVGGIAEDLQALWPAIVNAVSPEDFAGDQPTQKMHDVIDAGLAPVLAKLVQKTGVSFSLQQLSYAQPELTADLSACANDGFRETGMLTLAIGGGVSDMPDAEAVRNRVAGAWRDMAAKRPHTELVLDAAGSTVRTEAVKQTLIQRVKMLMDAAAKDTARTIEFRDFNFAPPVADASCKVPAPS